MLDPVIEPIISDASTDPRFHRAAATAAVSASDAGRLMLTGADARDLLNRLSTNLVDPNAPPGSVCATVLTSDRGRIVDLVYVIHCADHQLLLTSPGRQDAVAAFLDQYTIMEDLEVADITSRTVMLTLTGPTAPDALRAVLDGGELSAPIRPSAILNQDLAGTAREVIIGEPIVGERSLRAMLTVLPGNPAAAAPLPIYHLIYQEGESPYSTAARGITHLKVAGAFHLSPAAAETLRIARHQPRYGAEMSDAYNPLETGLIGAIDFHKGCYIGQEVIARLDTYHKVQKYLVALRFDTDADPTNGAPVPPTIPPPGARLLDDAGKPTGLVTSAAILPPAANANADTDTDANNGNDGNTPSIIGLGYVRTAAAQIGNRLHLAPPPDAATPPDNGNARPTPTITAEITALPQLFGGEQPAPTR